MTAVRLQRAGGVARIELHRPERLNALTADVAADLLTALRQCASAATRVVVLTGAGRAFCAGADLSPENRPDPADAPRITYEKLVGSYHPVLLAIRGLGVPVIAAVNGPAVGIGCSLALACDLVIAAESAFFLLAFVNIGLVPDGGASVWLPARIGAARAAEMMLLGERLPAARAAEWGLINRVVADDELAGVTEALASRIARGPGLAYAGIKRLADDRAYAGLDEQLEREARLQAQLSGSADHREGVTAFREKRTPEFHGR